MSTRSTSGTTLELTFLMEGNSTMTLTVPNPPEDLSLATVQEKAAKLIPVLVSNSGAAAVSLKKARLVETKAKDLA